MADQEAPVATPEPCDLQRPHPADADIATRAEQPAPSTPRSAAPRSTALSVAGCELGAVLAIAGPRSGKTRPWHPPEHSGKSDEPHHNPPDGPEGWQHHRRDTGHTSGDAGAAAPGHGPRPVRGSSTSRLSPHDGDRQDAAGTTP